MRKGKQLQCLLFAWFLVLLVSPFALEAQPDTWVTTFGSDVDDYPEDLLVDLAGNVYVTGFFRDTMYIGGQSLVSAGESDIFLAKFDPMGQLVWANRYGYAKNELAHAIALDTNGMIFVVGEYQDSAVIGLDTLDSFDTLWWGGRANTYEALWFRVTPTGVLDSVWDRGWFGSEMLFDVLIDPRTNESYFAGLYRTYNDWALNGRPWQDGHGRGYDDAIWARTNDDGYIRYRGVAKGTFVDKGKTIDLLNDSLVVMGGTFQDTCWFIDSVYFNLGSFDDDVFVACYGDTGNFNWVVTGASKGIDDLSALTVEAATGNIYFGGSFDSVFTMGGMSITGSAMVDGYIGKMDHTGQMLWLKSIAGVGFDHVEDVQVATNGDILVTGYFQRDIALGNGVSLNLTDTTDQNAFVIRMNGAGDFLWARSLGGDIGADRGINLKAGPGGSIYALGTFTGTGDFGQFSASSSGGTEAYLLKMNADGAVGVTNAIASTQLHVNMFPNPAQDQVEIQFDLKKPGPVTLSLLNLQGSVLRSQTASHSAGSNSGHFELDNIAAGMYIVQIASAEGKTALKLVIAK